MRHGAGHCGDVAVACGQGRQEGREGQQEEVSDLVITPMAGRQEDRRKIVSKEKIEVSDALSLCRLHTLANSAKLRRPANVRMR